jgi:hypothetical protein
MNDYHTHLEPFYESSTMHFLLGSLKRTVAQDCRALVFFFMNSPHGDPGVIFMKIFYKEPKLAVSGTVQVRLKLFFAFNSLGFMCS